MYLPMLDTLMSYLLRAPFNIITLVILVLDIVALRAIWKDSSRTDTSKVLWSLLIFFFPVGGLLIWWFFGNEGSKTKV